MRDHPSCATCRFWDDTVPGPSTCHRHPPQQLGVGISIDPIWVWPEADDTDWCGEWEGASDDALLARHRWTTTDAIGLYDAQHPEQREDG